MKIYQSPAMTVQLLSAGNSICGMSFGGDGDGIVGEAPSRATRGFTIKSL